MAGLAICGCASKAETYVPTTDGSVQIYLVRHARAYRNEPHPPGMTAEQLDSLTPHGLEQAKDAADLLVKKHVTTVIASPTHRTTQTAEIIAAALHLPEPTSDPAFGPMPEGEAPAEALGRAMAGLRDLATRHANGAIVIVTHGDICPLLIGEARGTALEKRMTVETIEPGSVTHLIWVNGRLKLAP